MDRIDLIRTDFRQKLYMKYFWKLSPAVKVLHSCKTKEQLFACCGWISDIINQSRKFEIRTHPKRNWDDIDEVFCYIFNTVLMASDDKCEEIC